MQSQINKFFGVNFLKLSIFLFSIYSVKYYNNYEFHNLKKKFLFYYEFVIFNFVLIDKIFDTA